MKERPILFSAPMVRAILDGRKTQTRRVVKWLDKPVPPEYDGVEKQGYVVKGRTCAALTSRYLGTTMGVVCPYGQPGDRLWVRERQEVLGRGPVTRRAESIRVRYLADGAESGILPYPARLNGEPVIGKCLSYGGYRESSRIDLEVIGVRVERVQAISEGDARAEGVEYCLSARPVYESLWNELNGARGFGWEANPWVWVVAFKRVA